MPRRRRAFIDRAKARTYEVVYRPLRDASGTDRVLRVVERANAPGSDSATLKVDGDNLAYVPNSNVNSTSPTTLPYDRAAFEFSEYGFPDDGYDYAKHFRTIGAEGGVFIPALNVPVEKAQLANTQIALRLRTDVGAEEDSQNTQQSFPAVRRTEEDEKLRANAIEEIRKERKRNAELDEVFAALDSEGELDTDSNTEDDIAASQLDEMQNRFMMEMLNGVGEDVDEDDEFPDDFLALANNENPDIGSIDVSNEIESTVLQQGHETKTERRPRRLLDDQFDRLMKDYNDDDDDDEEEEEGNDMGSDFDAVGDGDGAVDDLNAALDDADLQALMAGLESTQLNDAEPIWGNVEKAEPESTENEVTTLEQHFDHEKYAEAAMNSAMDSLMDSYQRVSVEEVLSAVDGLEGARKAIEQAELEEKKRLEEALGSAQSEDSHDSELDAFFEEPEKEQWDCETIISTYTNLDNHPSVIEDVASRPRRARTQPPVIRLDKRTNVPVDYMQETRQRTNEAENDRDFGSRRVHASRSAPRRKFETKEEKKARKAAVKEAARTRRALKSEMKNAFAQEALLQNKHAAAMGKGKVAVQL